MKVYLIPGLGFDRQIFSKLDLNSYEVHYLDWIEPLKNEPIAAYALRMANAIPEGTDKIVLIGHSLGGIISQEIAQLRNIHQIILISSIRSRAENRIFFKLVKPLFIHKLFNKVLINNTIKLWGNYHGYDTAETKNMVKNMVSKQSNHYLQWALKALSIWQTPTSLSDTPIVQIHGKQDKTFPVARIKNPTHLIKDGGHFMVYRQAETISSIIQMELKK